MDADAFYRMSSFASRSLSLGIGARQMTAGPPGRGSGLPAGQKAHPALTVRGFDDLIAQLDARGAVWRRDEELPGVRRLYVDDPFGNRIELIDAAER